jgi:hypothetical protein
MENAGGWIDFSARNVQSASELLGKNCRGLVIGINFEEIRIESHIDCQSPEDEEQDRLS